MRFFLNGIYQVPHEMFLIHPELVEGRTGSLAVTFPLHLGLATAPRHMNDGSVARSAFMKTQAIAAALVLAAVGCTSPPSAPPQSTVGALGTPFFIAFKIPVCVVTVALSAPLAGA